MPHPPVPFNVFFHLAISTSMLKFTWTPLHILKIVSHTNGDAKGKDRNKSFAFNRAETLEIDATGRNIVYAALGKIYHDLELDVFFNNYQRKLRRNLLNKKHYTFYFA